MACACFSQGQASNIRSMDFWVGTWEVFEDGQKAGDDIVEKRLNGNGIFEYWKGVGGDKGESVFYFRPHENNWKQVWITEQGQYKEKVSHPVPGGIQFVGKVFLKNGKLVDDRTTLSQLPEGKVLQVIEDKIDGKNWKVMFKATYVRKTGTSHQS